MRRVRRAGSPPCARLHLLAASCVAIAALSVAASAFARASFSARLPYRLPGDCEHPGDQQQQACGCHLHWRAVLVGEFPHPVHGRWRARLDGLIVQVAFHVPGQAGGRLVAPRAVLLQGSSRSSPSRREAVAKARRLAVPAWPRSTAARPVVSRCSAAAALPRG